MFEAIVFMRMRCEDIEYCLKSSIPREFFFPPPLQSHIALEEKIGNCVVNDIKQSVIPQRENGPSRQGCTLDVSCLRECTEELIHSLAQSGRWSFVINNTFVFENNVINESRTERARANLREASNVRDGNRQRRR